MPKNKKKTIQKPKARVAKANTILPRKPVAVPAKVESLSRISKIIQRIRTIPMFVLIWLVLLVTILVAAKFSVVTGKDFSNADMISITFDHDPNVDVLDNYFKDQAITITDHNLVNNNLTLQLGTAGVDLTKVATDLKTQSGVLNVDSYENVNINPVNQVLYSVLYLGMVISATAFVCIMIGLRHESVAKRLQLWAADNVSVIVICLISVMVGTLGSRIKVAGSNLISLTPDSWNLLVLFLAGYFVGLTYLNFREDLREAFLNFWFGHR